MQVVTKMALEKLKKQPAIFVDPLYERFWLDFAIKVIMSVLTEVDITTSVHEELEEFIELLPDRLLEQSDINFAWEDESGDWPIIKKEDSDEKR